MIIYTVGVEQRGGSGQDHIVVSPICAYTSKEEAERHVQSAQRDHSGDMYFFWDALEMRDRFELDSTPDHRPLLPSRSHAGDEPV